MEQNRSNFLAVCLVDALEDENAVVIDKLLGKYKADPGVVIQNYGIAPIHYSCGMPNIQLAQTITRKFLECGADPNLLSDEKMTPVHVAAMHGRHLIVKELLEYGGELNVLDIDRKTPIHYAIDEQHFEVLQIMRNHIFEKKFQKKQQDLLQSGGEAIIASSTPLNEKSPLPPKSKFINTIGRSLVGSPTPIRPSNNNNLLSVPTFEEKKFTPNRINYNYDVTSPYYINITHRRKKTYPNTSGSISRENVISRSGDQADDEDSQKQNIFTLTRENIMQLSNMPSSTPERSRRSVIESWCDKVQRSRNRQSIINNFDEIENILDNIDDQSKKNVLENRSAVDHNEKEDSAISSERSDGSNSQVDPEELQTPRQQQQQQPQQSPCDTNASFLTAHEVLQEKNSNESSVSFIRSPRENSDFFIQMTEAYVHTDDENGLVFYETKLLNTQLTKSSPCPKQGSDNLDDEENINATLTTQSTNLTLPPDYDTDLLRDELTTFGEPPGPITKTTKRLYLKRLTKHLRNPSQIIADRKTDESSNFSVELDKTIRSTEWFQRIREYLDLHAQCSAFFANNENKKQMREGHLKQSFIYLLIDPRISHNLPAQSASMQKFDVWKQFLQSVFYVGKGKSTRPYSHLYDALKMHSRLNATAVNAPTTNLSGKNFAGKKPPISVELFKSSPRQLSGSKKLDRILQIWGDCRGVVCLNVFHNIVPIEAYTREAAMIDALSLQHLTNAKRGDYYGPMQTWNMRTKKCLGIALLFKAMQIYLVEGESYISPNDLF